MRECRRGNKQEKLNKEINILIKKQISRQTNVDDVDDDDHDDGGSGGGGGDGRLAFRAARVQGSTLARSELSAGPYLLVWRGLPE